MRRFAIMTGLVIASGLIAPTIGHGARAGEKHEEYKSPGSAKKLLLKEPIHGLKGEDVTIMHFAFPPGWVGDQHYHTGPAYVYVLKGSFIVREKGKDLQTIPAGALYREPIGTPMDARNASTSEATEILVFQIGHEGEPMMVKTKF